MILLEVKLICHSTLFNSKNYLNVYSIGVILSVDSVHGYLLNVTVLDPSLFLTLSAALDANCVHCRDSVTALWTQIASTENIFFKYSW